jgi:hypothetical protein
MAGYKVLPLTDSIHSNPEEAEEGVLYVDTRTRCYFLSPPIPYDFYQFSEKSFQTFSEQQKIAKDKFICLVYSDVNPDANPPQAYLLENSQIIELGPLLMKFDPSKIANAGVRRRLLNFILHTKAHAILDDLQVKHGQLPEAEFRAYSNLEDPEIIEQLLQFISSQYKLPLGECYSLVMTLHQRFLGAIINSVKTFPSLAEARALLHQAESFVKQNMCGEQRQQVIASLKRRSDSGNGLNAQQAEELKKVPEANEAIALGYIARAFEGAVIEVARSEYPKHLAHHGFDTCLKYLEVRDLLNIVGPLSTKMINQFLSGFIREEVAQSSVYQSHDRISEIKSAFLRGEQYVNIDTFRAELLEMKDNLDWIHSGLGRKGAREYIGQNIDDASLGMILMGLADRSISELNFANNKIGKIALQMFSTHLKARPLPELHTLWLNKNPLKTDGLKVLAEQIVSQLPNLQVLHLQSVDLAKPEKKEVLATSLATLVKNCPKLKVLWLSSNGLGDDVLQMFVHALKEEFPPSLECLAIADNNITIKGVLAFRPILKQLQHIDLGDNPLGDIAMAEVMKSINSRVRELHLRNTGFGTYALAEITRRVQKEPELLRQLRVLTLESKEVLSVRLLSGMKPAEVSASILIQATREGAPILLKESKSNKHHFMHGKDGYCLSAYSCLNGEWAWRTLEGAREVEKEVIEQWEFDGQVVCSDHIQGALKKAISLMHRVEFPRTSDLVAFFASFVANELRRFSILTVEPREMDLIYLRFWLNSHPDICSFQVVETEDLTAECKQEYDEIVRRLSENRDRLMRSESKDVAAIEKQPQLVEAGLKSELAVEPFRNKASFWQEEREVKDAEQDVERVLLSGSRGRNFQLGMNRALPPIARGSPLAPQSSASESTGSQNRSFQRGMGRGLPPARELPPTPQNGVSESSGAKQSPGANGRAL